jgi:methanogenic corrinoid protein MtbC1/predicted XRE-type DNA-binding protein
MNDLGKNIKHLRKKEKYSQKELAEILGVSQTSIAHYEAGTRQPTIETLMEISQLFNQPIDLLVGNKTTEKENELDINNIDLIEILVEALVTKNEKMFMDYVKNNIYPVYELKSMIEDVLKGVMYKIGLLWERGIISEADEHYATNIVRKVVNYVSIQNENSLKNRKAVTFTVGSDKHTLGLEMVNTCLESQGIETIYLGSNLPIRSIDKVLENQKPEFIFISITMNDSMNSLINLINHINEKYKSEIIIGVGGQGFVEDKHLLEHQNLHILTGMDDLIDLLVK